MPSWLIKVVLNVVIAVGLPLAKGLLPFVPQAVWLAIEEILRHIGEQESKEDRHVVAHNFREKTRECVNGVCPADVVK